jgi:hypothetical protein
VSLAALVLAVALGCDVSSEGGDTGIDASTSDATGPVEDGGSISATSTSGANLTTTTDDPATTADDPTMPPSGFIYGMSDGGGGVSFECDLFVQDCEPGEKCSPWANDGGEQYNATRCVPLDPDPVGSGEVCEVTGSAFSGVDNCDGTSQCFHVDPTSGLGECVDFCTNAAEAPVCVSDTQTCALLNDGSISLCLETCDPLLQGCPESRGCYPVNDSFGCMRPLDDGGVAFGDACEYVSDCAPGMLCLGASAFTDCASAGCCSDLCDHTDPQASVDCAAADPGMGCEPWFIPGLSPAGFEDVGVCALPI